MGGDSRPKRVFISYAQESAEHSDQVRNLWIFLRRHGIDAKLDRTANERRQDWALWMGDQVREADVVLCVASEQYRRRAEGRAGPDVGRGVQWEARLIRDAFYAAQDDLQKFVPVVVPGQSRDGVPDFLAPSTSTVYHVRDFTLDGAEPLLRFLLDQPAETEPPLGAPPTFDRRDHTLAAPPPDPPRLTTPRIEQRVEARDSSLVIQAGRDVTVNAPPPSKRGGDVTPLVVRIDSIRSCSDGWFHAFRGDDAGAADVLARAGRLPRDVAGMDTLLRDQLTAGAYLLCSEPTPAVVVLSLYNPNEHDAVVRDVTVTDKRDEPVVAGTAFLIPAGAWNEDPITFDLDAPYPLARLVEGGVDKGAYFTTHRVVVPALGRVALPLRLAATRAAHTFALVLTYDCAGRSLAETVADDGRPFALSPMSRHYERVFTMEYTDRHDRVLVERPLYEG